MAKLTKIEYGLPSGNDALTVRLGIEKGIFEEEGIDLSTRIVFGGPELADAFDSGDLPIGGIGSPSGINAMATGKRFKIIGSGCRQRAHMFLGVRKGIENYEALKGKRIGLLSIGSCPSWIVRKILIHQGLDPDTDVTLVPLMEDYPRIVEFLEDGKIDAFLATEPNLSIGEDKGILDIWAAAYEEPYLPDYQWIVRVANTDFIEREPDIVAAVLRGCQRSAHYAIAHADEFATFMAKLYNASEEATRRAVARETPHYQLDCGDYAAAWHSLYLVSRVSLTWY
ncbi:MAG: ABC transporter substrate-binding protein [Moritella sp.]|nr:ABC transporter substrate-binding protein [Moritella sp.]